MFGFTAQCNNASTEVAAKHVLEMNSSLKLPLDLARVMRSGRSQLSLKWTAERVHWSKWRKQSLVSLCLHVHYKLMQTCFDKQIDFNKDVSDDLGLTPSSFGTSSY